MKKKTIVPSITREQAEQYLFQIASLMARERKINAEIDAEILRVKNSKKAALENIATEIKQKEQLLSAWGAQNPDEFKTRRSILFRFGRIGYRTGQLAFKTVSKFNLEKVIAAIKAKGWTDRFLRVVAEVDKEAIIAAKRDGKVTDEELREIGCRVVQGEAFFVEPDLSKAEERLTTPAK